MKRLLIFMALLAAVLPAQAQRRGRGWPEGPVSFEIFQLAGGTEQGQFPPTLNTVFPASELRPDETPDGYGFDLTVDGMIGRATVPTGTARVLLSTNISSVTYYWTYHRLWRPNGTALEVYAPYYDDAVVKQGLGKMLFSEDTNSILTLIAFGTDSLFLPKSTGGYVINNCADSRVQYFQRSDLIQEMACTNASFAVELNGTVYASNVKGVFGYREGIVTEITKPIRNVLTGATNVALTADYDRNRLIIGTNYVWDAAAQRLYKYSGSGFRFTTRQFRLPNWAPFGVDRLLFVIEHGNTVNGKLSYQVRYEDAGWSPTYNVRLDYADERYTVVAEDLAEARTSRRFQVRLTDLSSGKYIKEIRIDARDISFDDFSE